MSESAGRVIARRADGIGGVDRMYDSQWVNVVNHDNCYRGWDENDAIAHAVRMTEKYMAENNAAFRAAVRALADWLEFEDEKEGLSPYYDAATRIRTLTEKSEETR